MKHKEKLLKGLKMNEDKKKKEPVLLEFRNTTENTLLWITVGEEARKVPPGESTFMTENQKKVLAKHPSIISGELRQVTGKEILSGDIKVRDDMNDMEIKYMVEKCPTAQALSIKMRNLTSVTTVSQIRDECEKQDKPISFMRTCMNKINAIQDRLAIELKNAAKEERKVRG